MSFFVPNEAGALSLISPADPGSEVPRSMEPSSLAYGIPRGAFAEGKIPQAETVAGITHGILRCQKKTSISLVTKRFRS
jgi:hypothetical protein